MCLAIFPRVPTVIDPLMVIIHTGMELDLCHAEEKTFTAQQNQIYLHISCCRHDVLCQTAPQISVLLHAPNYTLLLQQCNNKKEKTRNNSVHAKMPNITP